VVDRSLRIHHLFEGCGFLAGLVFHPCRASAFPRVLVGFWYSQNAAVVLLSESSSRFDNDLRALPSLRRRRSRVAM
jgi:hypothetical protein